MSIEFEERIKKIEKELLAIKTASEFSSIRSANLTSPSRVTTGLYRIDYNNTATESIISMFYKNDDNYCYIYPRTPDNNSQIVEINTTEWINSSQSYITYESTLVVVSNVPVTSITRIS